MPEGVTVRQGVLDESSLLDALADEERRGRSVSMLGVAERGMELTATRILALGRTPFDALRAVMPRVRRMDGLPAGGWCLLVEGELLPAGLRAADEEMGPPVQCSPAGTS
jgi:hypothetical protein